MREYGLYVMDEADLETHGLLVGDRSQLSDDPRWKRRILTDAAMVGRTNHPSIIIWSLKRSWIWAEPRRHGRVTRKADPTRPIH